MTTTTYDVKCYDLAEHFLGDHPHLQNVKRTAGRATANCGGPTPNPCNQYADRQHWFLVS